MDLRDLRAFAAVDETRNLSRAALDLHLAQPALSRLVQDLEQELGVTLLERGPKGVTPTPAGEAFARGATQILAEIVTALDRAAATAAGRRGRVVVGALRSVIAHGFTAEVEQALRESHPDITFVLRELDFIEIVESLEGGGIDLALGAEGSGTRDIVSAPLWEGTVDVALLPASHPLASHKSVTLKELKQLPFVLGPQGYPGSLMKVTMAALQEGGLASPLLVLEAGLHGVFLAVSAGRGWTLTTRMLAAAPPQGTVAVPLEGFGVKWNVAAMWRFEERRPVVRTLLEAVFAVARRVEGTRLPEPRRAPPRPPPTPPEQKRPSRRLLTEAGKRTPPPALELRHLRALLGVAATQTIGRAAERLGVTQPALSRQLKELEHAIDLPLLVRSARGVMLTPAGAALAGDCPPLLLAIERLVQETTRARRGMEGRCVIGAVATAMTSQLLTRTLSECGTRHPDIEITIEELPTPDVPAAIARGDLDLGLTHPFPGLGESQGLERELVVDDRMNLALVAAGSPLARRTRLEPEDLAELPFLFIDRAFHPALYDQVMDALDKAGIKPRIEGTYDGLRSLWAFVAQGKGWFLGFRSMREQPPPGTVGVPIAGFDMPWGILLLRRKETPTAAVGAVLEILRETRRPQPKEKATRKRRTTSAPRVSGPSRRSASGRAAGSA